MTSHNLHDRNLKRKRHLFRRSRNPREPYDVVLIVCEGEKTEPNYIAGLCEELQLSTANIKVLGIGADPLTIVNYAIEEYDRYKDYDQVYCVFDKDEHSTYQAALDKILTCQNRKENKVPIHAITSVPCFEYWLLLHFVDSAKPYVRSGNKTAGDQLLNAIRVHISKYKKGHPDIYGIVKTNISIAITRAKRIANQQEKSQTDNPTTRFYQLIEYLLNIKNK